MVGDRTKMTNVTGEEGEEVRQQLTRDQRATIHQVNMCIPNGDHTSGKCVYTKRRPYIR